VIWIHHDGDLDTSKNQLYKIILQEIDLSVLNSTTRGERNRPDLHPTKLHSHSLTQADLDQVTILKRPTQAAILLLTE